MKENNEFGLSEPKYHVYADGCCEPNPSSNMGIGVYSEEAGILISERLNRWGTNNVAECLAAIRAIEECRSRGLAESKILTDSQLVVGWVSGAYQCRSETARAYVPQIREGLKAIRGGIGWVRGSDNAADRPSREAIGAWTDPSLTPLQRIASLPQERLGFEDFAKLKCGRDRFSALKLGHLRTTVSPEDFAKVTSSLAEERHQAACLRWVLRGLDVEKALRKTKVDREIGERARRSWRPGSEDDWPASTSTSDDQTWPTKS